MEYQRRKVRDSGEIILVHPEFSRGKRRIEKRWVDVKFDPTWVKNETEIQVGRSNSFTGESLTPQQEIHVDHLLDVTRSAWESIMDHSVRHDKVIDPHSAQLGITYALIGDCKDEEVTIAYEGEADSVFDGTESCVKADRVLERAGYDIIKYKWMVSNGLWEKKLDDRYVARITERGELILLLTTSTILANV